MSSKTGGNFGTLPVFLTAISTILGAIMFLRFGFSVGTVGLVGTIAIVLIGHAITIPTAMAIAEIATNQKVEGGGEYYIISRSFGIVIGSAIGIALYFSQAISVAFYSIAFAEAFNPLISFLQSTNLPDWIKTIIEYKQLVSIPALIVLALIVLTKGADLGVKALYIVAFILFTSLVAFFAGDAIGGSAENLLPNEVVELLDPDTAGLSQDTLVIEQAPLENKSQKKDNRLPIGFFTVFAIIFPAFTGMTAGVGLSGDLKKPSKSIPLGTVAATISGMIIYFLIAYKLSISASPEALSDTSSLVMADIAWQGWWLIPLGLAAATVSSALGSIMVAPRTLQAIARDRILPSKRINYLLSRGKGENDEPYNASILTVLIALFFVILGGLDFVAEIISMFFMVTYGSLCLISFLQHFSADPSYRPSFKSKWYLSLFGAFACLLMMFLINTVYAILALVMMVVLYLGVSYYNPEKRNVAVIFQGVVFQLSRKLQVFLQKAEKEKVASWRPSVVCISSHSFNRFSAFELLSWISHKYGFGTYIHKIDGYLSKSTSQEAKEAKNRLIKTAEVSKSNVFIDTVVSPSFTSAIAQVIQLPGISGKENNLLLLEYKKEGVEGLKEIVENFKLVKSVDFDVVILASSERGYGLRKSLHVWITSNDYENANLMILLAYIISGHDEWRKSKIKLFALYPEESINEERERLLSLIKGGHLPISPANIIFIERTPDRQVRSIINEYSKDADLSLIGFHEDMIKHAGSEIFSGYESLGNILFVNAATQKNIK